MINNPIDNLSIYWRISVVEDENKMIRCQVTANFAIPFLDAIIGYSEGGQSFAVFGSDRLLCGIPARLLIKTSHQMKQVLQKTRSLSSFTDQTVEEIAANITIKQDRASTAANLESSRAHIVICFENLETDTQYTLHIDLACHKQSGNIAALDAEMSLESTKIVQDNLYIRQFLQAVVTGNDLLLYKHSSKLNSRVSESPPSQSIFVIG